ncbi:mitochondrial RNA-binding protein RBP38 [Perkinsela sp. CCAP 1560/4]|nr:mitochondrial RNA-binding protein RBP38 [Perkinsela sp. CCAP 1560/4]|eukprot:KNH01405.1 mitochondrial RNA-binding protein RBP38 [Perkinsela sp. CCAP 1560/4]
MVVSGRKIHDPVARELALKKYASRWWITSKHAKRLWIDIRDSEPAYVTPNNVSIYNITQTDQASRLEKYAGKVIPTWAVSAEEVAGPLGAALFRHLTNQVENTWIKAEEVSILGLKVKQGRDPTVVQFNDERRMELYNLEEMADPLQARFHVKRYPMSAITGSKYMGEVAKKLLTSSLAHSYSSPYWTTKAYADYIGVKICPDETPTRATSNDRVLELFNADQTCSPDRVTGMALRNTVSPRNLRTGMFFKEPLSSELLSYAMKTPAKLDMYWMTHSYANAKKAAINFDAHRVYLSIHQGKTTPWLNVNASTDPKKLLQRAHGDWVRPKSRAEAEKKTHEI